MANQDFINQLETGINELLTYKEKELINRPAWGEINFEPYTETFNRLWELVDSLNVLPLDYLNKKVLQSAQNKINEIKERLDQIDNFVITVENPSTARDNLGNQLRARVNELYDIVAIWIPFLAFQKGDVSRNIEQLTSTLDNAKGEVENAKKKINEMYREIEEIIEKAREASAEAGAAVFTEEFKTESTNQVSEAKNWLNTTIGLAIGTFFVAIAFLINSIGGWVIPETNQEAWIFISAKITIFLLLFSATVWTSKIYRALRHQASTNMRRALGLKTFQAFSAAAPDDQTKSAVLLETTRSIFANTSTGFVEGHMQNKENESTFIEIIKSVANNTE